MLNEIKCNIGQILDTIREKKEKTHSSQNIVENLFYFPSLLLYLTDLKVSIVVIDQIEHSYSHSFWLKNFISIDSFFSDFLFSSLSLFLSKFDFYS